MDTKEQSQNQASTEAKPGARRFRAPAVVLLVIGLAVGSAAFVVNSLCGPDPTPPKETPIGASWSYEEVFPHWKDRKPEFVIVITGQTYGYLQKCGCSDPQKGGLERRYNFLEGLKSHGIEAVPLDLGDVAPQVSEDSKIYHPQALLRYQVAMSAMKAMGYRAVGLGKEEFALGLHEALSVFSIQPGNEQPRILAANLIGFMAGNQVLDKKLAFPDANGKDTAVRDWDIVSTRSKIPVGIVGIVGEPIVQEVKKIDANMVFAETKKLNSEKVVDDSLSAMSKEKNPPKLSVLLYSGPLNLAMIAAKRFPQFNVVVCRSEEAEPPNAPMMLPVNGKKNQNTMIVRVGHKGQNAGVIGVFKNKDGGFELEYQRVTLTPKFETPADQVRNNVALQELERYSKLVRDRGFLTQNRKVMHPLQVANKNAAFVGAQTCVACHNGPVHNGTDNSSMVWTASKHAGAYNALVNIASKPSLRQFDGECIRCHTVGYDYNTGFVDAVKTPNLINVGCESCHGPGSQHAANPNNKAFALELSPWKINGMGKLPDAAKLKAFNEELDPAKKQAILTAAELRLMLNVDRTCQTCHNAENDPHFKFEVFWPKIAHGVQPPVAKGVAPAPKGNNGNGKVVNPVEKDPAEAEPAAPIPAAPLPK